MTEPAAEPSATARKLVKARLRPDVHGDLAAYAERTHRSLSSAAEFLIDAGLRAEGARRSPGAEEVHYR